MSRPTFFIIGAQKAGTTALYTYLRRHPEIYMSPVKEPMFMAPDLQRRGSGPGDRAPRRFDTLEKYEELFADTSPTHTARGEASVAYLYSAVAACRISELVPDARLIAILRDPAERAYSNFKYLRREGREPLADFEAALEAEHERIRRGWSDNWHYRAKGFYAEQVSRYLGVFPRERLRLYRYEDFSSNPAPILRDLYEFVGVNSSFRQPLGLRVNRSGEVRSPAVQRALDKLRPVKWALEPVLPASLQRQLLRLQELNLVRAPLAPSVRERLIDEYRDDLLRLQELTGFDVQPWLTSKNTYPPMPGKA
jgi:hypothetical protein